MRVAQPTGLQSGPQLIVPAAQLPLLSTTDATYEEPSASIDINHLLAADKDLIEADDADDDQDLSTVEEDDDAPGADTAATHSGSPSVKSALSDDEQLSAAEGELLPTAPQSAPPIVVDESSDDDVHLLDVPVPLVQPTFVSPKRQPEPAQADAQIPASIEATQEVLSPIAPPPLPPHVRDVAAPNKSDEAQHGKPLFVVKSVLQAFAATSQIKDTPLATTTTVLFWIVNLNSFSHLISDDGEKARPRSSSAAC